MIPLSRIESDTYRNVTFSKRRSGLINEISTVCGAEILMVIFSPSGKPHTFSNSSMDAILTKYFGANPTAQPNYAEQNFRVHREVVMQILSSQITYFEMKIEEEMKVNQTLRETEKLMQVHAQARIAQIGSCSFFGYLQFGANDDVVPSGGASAL
ncbi:agamous-like MADS-box protein AGL61 [Ipomoea triloba]|uniref:agamous-like MADS-box protein AGL61 n=1 Tax=Ipomoea triloba TaxID=35885 RepID=UPI00125DFB85|nr:agamous-like MADS-box protein AGL61 [Ipomoea triloba]